MKEEWDKARPGCNWLRWVKKEMNKVVGEGGMGQVGLGLRRDDGVGERKKYEVVVEGEMGQGCWL